MAASNKEFMLYFVEFCLDGVGISGSINSTHSYPKDCRNARDMFVSNGSLFIAKDCGVLRMDLNSNSHVFLVFNKTRLCTEMHGIAPFGDNGHIVFTWSPNRLRLHNRMVTSRLLPEPGKQAKMLVHVRRFPSKWVYVWKTTKSFLSPMLK